MTELATALIADSYAAAPSHVLEGLTEQQAHQRIPNLPHTIYEELWHLAFWQRVTLNWIAKVETPFPARPEDGFPTPQQIAEESFDALRTRFLTGAAQSAINADDLTHLDDPIRCPSRPGYPVRIMSIRDQLISLATHNAYHLGRIVVLRQFQKAWPPPSGGYSW
ncbi:MAG: hypothetical protein JWM43_3071 [Acidobacteriaceae bacterium]|nr:hypothetical protein [Acidobacteriaceae bacterium]